MHNFNGTALAEKELKKYSYKKSKTTLTFVGPTGSLRLSTSGPMGDCGGGGGFAV
jgi:hypothetical protein